MTIGELMRKAKVTPSGMPASTKPMKSGTAEQEQNGVTMPNEAAAAEPATVPRPASADRTFSGGKKPRISVTTVMMPEQEQQHLGHVEQEEGDRLAEVAIRARGRRREKVSQSESGASVNQATSQATTEMPTVSLSGRWKRPRTAPRLRVVIEWAPGRS